MAEISKQALKVENNTSFPNNNTGAITPSDLRAFNVDMIDSLVDEITYNVDSASWNQQINALEAFTSSQQPSFTALNQFTASQLVINSGVNAFTQSADARLDALESETQNLELFTSSVNQIADNGIVQGTSTRLHFYGLVSASIVPNVNGAIASINIEQDGTKLNSASFNSYTASTDSDLNSIHQTTQSLNNFTASLTTAFVSTASFNSFTQSINSYTSSNNTKWSNLQSQSGSWITESESGSFLVTASVNLNTITFTKGDASTFNITVNTGSGGGGTTDLTSLNAFTASQNTKNSTLASVTASLQQQLTNIGTQSGSWVTSAITASSIITASVSNDDITFTKGDGSQFTIQVATGSFALSSSYAETASLAQNALDIIVTAKNTTGVQLNKGTVVRIIGATGDNPLIGTASWTDDDNSANTLGFVTANIPNDNFGRVITQGTLLGINTDPALGYAAGQLLYLSASGQYTNVKPPAPYHEVRLGQVMRAQQNNGSAYVLIQNGYELSELHDVDINTGSLANKDLLAYNSATLQWENESIGTLGLATTGSNTFDGNQIISGGVTLSGSLGITYVDGGAEVIQQVTALGNYQTLYDGGLLFQTDGINDYEQTIHTTLSKGLTVNDGSVLNSGVTITGGLTGSLQQGYAWVGNAAGVSVPVPTSSFAGGGGGQTFANPSIESISGSVVLSALTFTSGAANLLHLTASAQNQANLVFKNNNNTADTIISGSNNIFVNPAAPTAGFKRYVGGSNNIFNTISLPQISGSMGFSPTMGGNIGIGSYTFRGPVSSSAWNINSNYNAGTINLGSSAALNAEKLTGGLNMSANLIQGTVSIIANTNALTGSNTAMLNNSINGGVTLNLTSSAASLSNNIINDSGFILYNNFYSSSVGLGALNMNRNTIGGQSNSIIAASGLAAGVFTATSISDNAILGGNNILYLDSANARVSGSSVYHNAVRNIILGNQMIVTGSSLTSDLSSFGSTFVGRYNADDARRNKTSDVIFAVGTGNTGARKTGFLIDSGSNTFVEGTLNVSGSSSYTGSVYGNVVSMSVTSNTASMNLALGNYFELTSSASPLRIELSNIKAGQTATLIVSASVSSSIAFSSNIGQPSPGAYSGSAAASVDILSFVAFNNSRANLVATKNIV